MTNGTISFGSAAPGALYHLAAHGWPVIGRKPRKATSGPRGTGLTPPDRKHPICRHHQRPWKRVPILQRLRRITFGRQVIGREPGRIGIGPPPIMSGLLGGTSSSAAFGITRLSGAAFSLRRFILSR